MLLCIGTCSANMCIPPSCLALVCGSSNSGGHILCLVQHASSDLPNLCAQLCGDDAYEQRSIPSPDRCLLGRNISTTMRKADAACFNGKGWQRPQGLEDFCTCEQARSLCMLWMMSALC